MEGALHAGGELAGFLDFVLGGDFLQEGLEFKDVLAVGGIFAGGDFKVGAGVGEIEVEGFGSGDGAEGGRIGVDGEEEVGAGAIGEGGSFFEGDEDVFGAGVDDFSAEAFFEQGAEAFGDVEDKILFVEAAASGSPEVVAAVAGIEDDAGEFQAEGAGEGAFSGDGVDAGGFGGLGEGDGGG